MARAMETGASAPCTTAGAITIWMFGIPPERHLDDVPHRGPRRRGRDPQPPREEGDGPFPRRVEDPLLRELLLQELDPPLEIADALGPEHAHVDLVAAPLFVHGDAPQGVDSHPLPGLEVEGAVGVPEKHRGDHRVVVPEAEVDVPGRMKGQVEDLALDPDIVEIGPPLQGALYAPGYLGY